MWFSIAEGRMGIVRDFRSKQPPTSDVSTDSDAEESFCDIEFCC